MLSHVNQCYGALAPFRANRNRLRNFTFGRQWQDMTTNLRGEPMTEAEHAIYYGRKPLTNNLIHKLVKTLTGHFRTAHADDVPTPDDHNRLSELDARMFEEYLISGCAVQRITKERRPGYAEVLTWVDNVSPDKFFCYPLRDPRLLDLEIIGMFHTMPLAEALARFAQGSRQRASELRTLLADPNETPGFEHCQLIEVWHREARETLRCHDPLKATLYNTSPSNEAQIEATNRRRTRRREPRISARFEVQTRWVGRWLTMDGKVIATTEAPRHPFAVKFYPLLDGEIHSFVAGMIDQQKHINRLLTIMDSMMSSSAKGVLLFPEGDKSDSTSWEMVQEMWAAHDGVIPYTPRAGSPGPHQVVSNPTASGITEMIQLEVNLFDKASGVGFPMQGNSESGIQSARLYDAQLQNCHAAVADLFASYADFRSARNSLLF